MVRRLLDLAATAKARFWHYSRAVGIALVATALTCCTVLGFLLIIQRAQYADLVRCTVEYNQLDGTARDERATKSVEQTDAAIAWLTALKDGIENQSLDQSGLVKTIDDYSGALKSTKTTQAKNPYPPPDYCSENGEGRR